MKPRSTISALIVVAILLSAISAPQQAFAAPPDVRVLLIGSSLVRGVKSTLKKMYRQDGLKAQIKAFAPAKWTLHDHAGSGRTASLIAARPWDVVLMAQASLGATIFDLPDVTILDDLITAQGATSGLLMTWYDQEVPASNYDLLKGTPDGSTGYVPLAFALDIFVAPAGWGVRNVLVDIEQGNPIAQTLDLWKRRAHLGKAGRYLAGAIVYTTLTGNSPVGQWTPNSLDGSVTDYLQTLAADTVLTDPTEWNLP